MLKRIIGYMTYYKLCQASSIKEPIRIKVVHNACNIFSSLIMVI